MHLRAVNLEIKMLSHKEIKLNIYFYCNKLTECNYIKFLWLSKSWLDMEALVFVLSFYNRYHHLLEFYPLLL